MDNLSHCTARQGCSNIALLACSCIDPFILICQECIQFHLSQPLKHLYISIDQARDMLQDLKHHDFPSKSYSKYIIANSLIHKQLKKLNHFKLQLQDFKIQAINQIEQECNEKLNQLNAMHSKLSSQLEFLHTKMTAQKFNSGCFLTHYEVKTLRQNLKKTEDSFHLYGEDLTTAISNMIVLKDYYQDKPDLLIPSDLPTDDHIFFPRQGTTQLIKYNFSTNRTVSYNLSQTVSKNFKFTSTCKLPDGNIMIVGGFDQSAYGDTYKFNVNSVSCTRMGYLNYPRRNTALHCQDQYLYAFGGTSQYFSNNKAEKMEWRGSEWTALPFMNTDRVLCGVYSGENKIYLIGGLRNCSVEYYDIAKNTFLVVSNITVPEGGNLVGSWNDKIYIISSNTIMIVNKEFKIENSEPFYYNKNMNIVADKVKEKNGMYFYCSRSQNLMKFDVRIKTIQKIAFI